MTILAIETFATGALAKVRERFETNGRMLPPDVTFVKSWFTPDGRTCYQLMEAPSLASCEPWLAAWSDLVDIKVLEIVPSEEFWAKKYSETDET